MRQRDLAKLILWTIAPKTNFDDLSIQRMARQLWHDGYIAELMTPYDVAPLYLRVIQDEK